MFMSYITINVKYYSDAAWRSVAKHYAANVCKINDEVDVFVKVTCLYKGHHVTVVYLSVWSLCLEHSTQTKSD